jgi:hypothetical protein
VVANPVARATIPSQALFIRYNSTSWVTQSAKYL